MSSAALPPPLAGPETSFHRGPSTHGSRTDPPSSALNAPRLSILIPAYNEERNILPLLRFLRTTPEVHQWPTEVLVDVSGSTDLTPELVRRLALVWPAIRVLDSGRRDGLLVALNRLIRASRAEFLVRIDADVRPAPGTLSRLLGRLAEPWCGIVGARVVPGPSASPIVTTLSRGEFELHHLISLQEPKTTVLQAFRKGTIELPLDSGVEDVALQEQATLQGRRAAYAGEAPVFIMPPATTRSFLLQRIRSIRHSRTHRRRGYTTPSTGSPRVALVALREALGSSWEVRFSVLSFLLVELLARAMVAVAPTPSSHLFNWEPVDGTKWLDWSGEGPSGSP